jgi:hypothetical protein
MTPLCINMFDTMTTTERVAEPTTEDNGLTK